MNRKSIKEIQKLKKIKKIIGLTAYTTAIATIIDDYVDIILVGDSLGTVIYGMKNTQNVSLDMMMVHGKAVVDSSKNAFTIVDMPYHTYRNNREALLNAKKLINYTKCQSVKLENDQKNINVVKYLTKNKIKVVAHIGVTPQKYKNFNKIRSIGQNKKESEKIVDLALKLEKAGSIMIVLECMKESLAKEISKHLSIPTIGIGASIACDGQILVTNDILGINKLDNKPRFVKQYANINKSIQKAVKKYSNDIVNKKFPKIKNTY